MPPGCDESKTISQRASTTHRKTEQQQQKKTQLLKRRVAQCRGRGASPGLSKARGHAKIWSPDLLVVAPGSASRAFSELAGKVRLEKSRCLHVVCGLSDPLDVT
jgi:hypothetical protein